MRPVPVALVLLAVALIGCLGGRPTGSPTEGSPNASAEVSEEEAIDRRTGHAIPS